MHPDDDDESIDMNATWTAAVHLSGLAVLCLGIGMIYLPAALIVVGVGLVMTAAAYDAGDDGSGSDS